MRRGLHGRAARIDAFGESTDRTHGGLETCLRRARCRALASAFAAVEDRIRHRRSRDETGHGKRCNGQRSMT
jgi:hypothetical protein